MFCKLVRYDIRAGIADRIRVFAAPLLIYMFAFVNYIVRVNSYISQGNALNLGRSLGDVLLFIYGGMKEYDPDAERRFSFPALWMLLYLLLAYIVLYYPHRDLEENGQNILIRTGGRELWWLSKCVWSALTVVLYFIDGWAVAVLGCILTGVPLTMKLSPNINVLFEMSGFGLRHPDALAAETMIMPLLVMISVSLMQMALSLYVRPVFSFIITIAVLLAGTYFMNPLFISNYAMPVRSSGMITGGVSSLRGYLICIVLTLASITGGMIRFLRYDILSREN